MFHRQHTTPPDTSINEILVTSDSMPSNLGSYHTSIQFITTKNHGINPITMYNGNILRTEYSVSTVSWIVYGFGSGILFDSIRYYHITFEVKAGVDSSKDSLNMLQNFGGVSTVNDSTQYILTLITKSSKYAIHS